MSVILISKRVGKKPQDISYTFVFDEAYRLVKRGLDVHVVRSFQEESSLSCGIHFHGLDNASRINYTPFLLKHLNSFPIICYFMPPWRLLDLAKYASAVVKVAKSQEFDLFHAHFAYPEGFAGLLAKREVRKPLVVTVHGYDILVESSIGYGLLLSRRFGSLVRKVLNVADAVITASSATFEEVCKVVKEKNRVHKVPNGVDIRRFNPNLDFSYLKEKLGLEGHAVVFALRWHEPTYGLEYLIRAASLVAKKRDDVFFVIGGDGTLRGYHEELAVKLGVEGKMVFTGRIPQDDVPYYYSMSDMVVVPSIQEAFGLVVSEAMACGKPVIGTALGGIPDQIIDGYNGFLVPTRDASAIAEKILWLTNNPSETRRMGMNGRRIVEEKFDIEKRVDAILLLYEQLLNV